MTNLILALVSALWIGVLTSVSPCPLATNVAATTVLARRLGNRRRAAYGIAAYTLGRVAAYILLAGILFLGLSSMPDLAAFLRQEVLPLVGPILILAGMAVLGWLPLPSGWSVGSAHTAERISRWGITGEFALGGLFALSFCPVSAALFFGSLMPLATATPFPLIAVMTYGIGTALPVGAVAFIAVFSADRAGKVLQRIQSMQTVAITATGAILILIGLGLTLTRTLRVID
ncbi:MAG: aromatic aminobenezylarsenical efflux permease ArsG family transporter [Puniceicoccales bacterium]